MSSPGQLSPATTKVIAPPDDLIYATTSLIAPLWSLIAPARSLIKRPRSLITAPRWLIRPLAADHVGIRVTMSSRVATSA